MKLDKQIEYAFGWPRGSVRAVMALTLTGGFVALMIAITVGVVFYALELSTAVGLASLYTTIYVMVLNFYFRSRDETDKQENAKV